MVARVVPPLQQRQKHKSLRQPGKKGAPGSTLSGGYMMEDWWGRMIPGFPAAGADDEGFDGANEVAQERIEHMPSAHRENL
ncbi:hypothetical protein Cni_G07935 [Canna indica]|uniref:Uncharacterized protein n=1 Tax=Canna indica TaxID=4628 RepID=A0AAQ3K174_9LILI|nr:hypothetical protein Cni_G07935 [Canna indica]